MDIYILDSILLILFGIMLCIVCYELIDIRLENILLKKMLKMNNITNSGNEYYGVDYNIPIRG
jgi:hypothetical protein